MDQQNLYEVAVTAIVVKEGKYLITRRAATKRKWPGQWTVPGSRLEPADYVGVTMDTDNAWYNILEGVVRREVKEETGLDIDNIRYATSLVAQYEEDKPHTLIISLSADWKSGDVVLQEEETDKFVWVTLVESEKYQLIPGIREELIMAERMKLARAMEWKKDTNTISIDEFLKMDLRIGLIKKAEKVEKSEKLVRLSIDDGTETGRVILAGIGPYYTVEELTGKKITFIANLEPRKMMGEMSCGMVLAAHAEDGGAVVLLPEKDVPPGSKIS
jgi:methionine--tRNA ligase beta chain